jgi:5'/3'-nucleotidase SurE
MKCSVEVDMRTLRLLSSAAIACVATASNPAAALNIALTNDDGWNAPGIQIMKTALVAAGHTVTLAAPLTDQSGSSMALDQVSLAVKKEAAGEYSVALWATPTVAAKPANSAYVAIGIVQEGGRSPDLLISGINSSANIGLSELLSGTVGAAAHAMKAVLNGGVPAIAIGTDVPTANCDVTCQAAHYQVVANFMVRFVAHLETKPGFLASEPGLLPAGLGLVVSYPGITSISGVKIAMQSETILAPGVGKVSGAIKCSSPGCAGLPLGGTQRARMVLVPDSTPDTKDSDLGYYREGYVTVVPIAANMTAPNPLRFKSILPGLAE